MPITELATSMALDKATEWIPKIINNLKPCKPEIKNVNINYLNKNTELSLSLEIPNDIRRKVGKIDIPNSKNFYIDNIMDNIFTDIDLGSIIETTPDKLRIKTSNLPNSEKFLIKLKGKLPQTTLDQIVFVQPAQNKDRKDGNEKYWLRSMIRDAESLENLWENLNVDNVKAGVNIGVERHISTNLPPELKKGLEAMALYSKSIYSSHWSDVRDSWLNLRKMKGSKITVKDLTDTIKTLSDIEFFSEFVEIDNPYNMGEIKNNEPHQTIPQKMYAEAITRLNLKKPIAEGYMTFRKENYVNSIKEKYNELL